MVCVGLSEKDLKNFGGPVGGPGKILAEQWPPWHPPSSAPGCNSYVTGTSCERSFSKMKSVKTFPRNSMTSDTVANAEIFMGGIWFRVIGGHLYLVCAVCDVTI